MVVRRSAREEIQARREESMTSYEYTTAPFLGRLMRGARRVVRRAAPVPRRMARVAASIVSPRRGRS